MWMLVKVMRTLLWTVCYKLIFPGSDNVTNIGWMFVWWLSGSQTLPVQARQGLYSWHPGTQSPLVISRSSPRLSPTSPPSLWPRPPPQPPGQPEDRVAADWGLPVECEEEKDRRVTWLGPVKVEQNHQTRKWDFCDLQIVKNPEEIHW